jgi:hypothetical protein
MRKQMTFKKRKAADCLAGPGVGRPPENLPCHPLCVVHRAMNNCLRCDKAIASRYLNASDTVAARTELASCLLEMIAAAAETLQQLSAGTYHAVAD